MKTIILKALAVATAIVPVTYALILFAVPLMGEPITLSAWVLGFLGPYLIGGPVVAFCFWQAEQLKQAHAELLKAHEQLREKSMRDQMTGMLNREAFLDRLEKKRRRADEGVLLIVDADHFKRINDNHGHLNGDRALLLIAGAIRASIRDCDLAGRIGGEEFAVLLSGADLVEAKTISERLRRNVEEIDYRTSAGVPVVLTVSTGGASTWGAASLSELMRNADRCLYEAKRGGRNRVVFAHEFRHAA